MSVSKVSSTQVALLRELERHGGVIVVGSGLHPRAYELVTAEKSGVCRACSCRASSIRAYEAWSPSTEYNSYPPHDSETGLDDMRPQGVSMLLQGTSPR